MARFYWRLLSLEVIAAFLNPYGHVACTSCTVPLALCTLYAACCMVHVACRPSCAASCMLCVASFLPLLCFEHVVEVRNHEILRDKRTASNRSTIIGTRADVHACVPVLCACGVHLSVSAPCPYVGVCACMRCTLMRDCVCVCMCVCVCARARVCARVSCSLEAVSTPGVSRLDEARR